MNEYIVENYTKLLIIREKVTKDIYKKDKNLKNP